MAGSMSEADLVADLKTSLLDAAPQFAGEAADGAYKRFLRQALPDMQTKRPMTKLGTLTLVANEASYSITEADFAALKLDLWRDQSKLPRPWAPTWPGPLPRIQAVQGAGQWLMLFEPAPTVAQLSLLGTAFKFWYFATHSIGADAADTTVAAQDRGLLLLRAQAEAMLALAMRNAGKPVQLRDGMSGTPRNSTPSALHQALMDLFRETR
jgi:hypothetical protein